MNFTIFILFVTEFLNTLWFYCVFPFGGAPWGGPSGAATCTIGAPIGVQVNAAPKEAAIRASGPSKFGFGFAGLAWLGLAYKFA